MITFDKYNVKKFEIEQSDYFFEKDNRLSNFIIAHNSYIFLAISVIQMP